MNTAEHWEKVYASKAPDTVSWYRPHLDVSMSFIERAAASPSASIIDVGCGESTLVDDLLERGYENITLLDVSAKALDVTRQRLGRAVEHVRWVEGDVTTADLPAHCFDIWHDRAVFHFLTRPEDRLRYVRQVLHAMRIGGHVIVGAFGPEGPLKCSGLDVVRYEASALHHEFGSPFRLVESTKELHVTPWGAPQQFLYCYCRVE